MSETSSAALTAFCSEKQVRNQGMELSLSPPLGNTIVVSTAGENWDFIEGGAARNGV